MIPSPTISPVPPLAARISAQMHIAVHQIEAAVALLDGGATVPFIARYRKEATGGLNDVQLRELQVQLHYFRELDARRGAIIRSIEEQGKLSPALLRLIQASTSKQELEDLYLPYKPKRRTKATIAKEAGLEPLAQLLLENPDTEPLQAARDYILTPDQNPEGGDFTNEQAVLNGVRELLSQEWAHLPHVVQAMREWMWERAWLSSQKIELGSGASEAASKLSSHEVEKFRDYFSYTESLHTIPSHRALAVFRGSHLGILNIKLQLHDAALEQDNAAANLAQKAGNELAEARLARCLGWTHQGRAGDDFLRKCVSWTWRVKLSLMLERELLGRLREQAEAKAIAIFAQNLRHLLLAAPAGPRVVMGLDPGIRTGVKVAVVDATGKLLDTATVYPHEPRKDWTGALHILVSLCEKHEVRLIAIGNGTASRETDQLAAEVMQTLAQRSGAKRPDKLVVSEAGASVYSASELASLELPDLDVSLRGAVSIARRVQDPLAELVKIEPKSIGVGQYQHDVNQTELARALDAVVEDCVNAVGVDVNTASIPLLTRVSGLGASSAKAIVVHREQHGAFDSRQDLLQVPGVGAKTFEQCAGFLRILHGSNPLDRTGVHPEAYPLVQAMLAKAQIQVDGLMGNSQVIRTLKAHDFVSPAFGLPTVQDILRELEKPGRDPRPDFKVARFQEGITDIHDLRAGMVLEGMVTNVVAFGAFVDIGVHQDGLVHLSQLAERYIHDASSVVKAGDIVRVRVQEVDIARKRIALTMRLQETQLKSTSRANRSAPGPRPAPGPGQSSRLHTAMGAAFAKSGLRSS